MKNVSMIIPAARNVERTQKIVDALIDLNTSVNVEVIVSSPGFQLLRALNVKDEMIGSAAAIAKALPWAEGDYIGWISDECFPTKDCLDVMVKFIDNHEVPFIAEFYPDDDERQYPIVGFYGVCAAFGMQYARWGMMSRMTLEKIGFWDEKFSSFYGDVDLGIRCWRAGGCVETCEKSVLKIQNQHDGLQSNNWSKSRDSDTEAFRKKWVNDYPQVMVHESQWNRDREMKLGENL